MDTQPTSSVAAEGGALGAITVFKRNIVLRDIVVKLRDESCVRGGKSLCGWCEAKAAVRECLDCKSPFCAACCDSVHAKPAFKVCETLLDRQRIVIGAD